MAHNKKEYLTALEKNLGVITSACKASNIPRRTVYNWLQKDEKFKVAVDDIQEVALDYVESKLLSNIKAGDTTAIIFYLKTKGKSRGYIERKEIEADLKNKENTVVILPSNGRD